MADVEANLRSTVQPVLLPGEEVLGVSCAPEEPSRWWHLAIGIGFILGIWAKGWEQLQIVPMLVVTPLTFLGGAFYSIDMLPGVWRKVALFNPVVYLISGFRWSFYENADVAVGTSLAAILGFFTLCLALVWWIFKTGYRLKQ